MGWRKSEEKIKKYTSCTRSTRCPSSTDAFKNEKAIPQHPHVPSVQPTDLNSPFSKGGMKGGLNLSFSPTLHKLKIPSFDLFRMVSTCPEAKLKEGRTTTSVCGGDKKESKDNSSVVPTIFFPPDKGGNLKGGYKNVGGTKLLIIFFCGILLYIIYNLLAGFY